jgi:hypothetical protein
VIFNVHGSGHLNNILIYIQQDATLQSLFYLETTIHVSDGTFTHHQERIQLYLQHLVFVTPLLLPVTIVEELELHSTPNSSINWFKGAQGGNLWDIAVSLVQTKKPI